MTQTNPSRDIFFVDTTLRDGQLSLWASNMRTAMMLPVAERLDRAGFEAIEVMSSAFYKKCVRDLKDDPWERIRLLAQRIKRTPLRTIRSRSMLAFQTSPAGGYRSLARTACRQRHHRTTNLGSLQYAGLLASSRGGSQTRRH